MKWIKLLSAKINGKDINIPTATGNDIVSGVLNAVYFITGMAAVVMILIGSYKYITASGDPKKAQSAMQTIIFAVVGLVIIISAFAITSFVIGKV